MKIVATKLDNSEYEKFNNSCLEKGLSKSERMRDLIRKDNKGSEDDKQTNDPGSKITVTNIT